MISRPLLNLMLALTLVLPAGAFAEEVQSESKDKNKGTDTDTDTAKSTDTAAKAPLSGNVVHSVKDAQIAVKDLGDTSKHLKDAAWCTFCEVQQPDQVYVGGPNIVGATMVIPAINTTGYLNTGAFLPPRPKWLKYFVQNVDYLSRQLDSEIAAAQMPDDASDNAKQSFARMNDLARGIPPKVVKLEAVTQNPPYQNMPIAVAAQEILDDLKEFEKLQKVVARELKRMNKK